MYWEVDTTPWGTAESKHASEEKKRGENKGAVAFSHLLSTAIAGLGDGGLVKAVGRDDTDTVHMPQRRRPHSERLVIPPNGK